MSFKLSVYTAKFFKEFLLPSVSNADYDIILDKNEFEIKESVSLKLENIEGVWHYRKSRKYQMLKDKQVYNGGALNQDDIIMIVTSNNEKITVIVNEVSKRLDAFEKYDISHINRITIGKNESNTIRFDMLNYISREHAELINNNGKWFVYDKSVNGVYVNSMRIQGKCELQFGDTIHIFGLHMIFCSKLLAINTQINIYVDNNVIKKYLSPAMGTYSTDTVLNEKQFFHRAPRNFKSLFSETVEIESPPEPRAANKRPLFLTIGPSLTMSIPMMLGCGMSMLASRASGSGSSFFMYTGIVTAVGSAMVGVFWALMNLRYASKEEKAFEEHRFDAYGDYLINIADSIENMYKNNQKVLNEEYPPASYCSKYDERSPFLWNRNFTHDDVLYHRLGMGKLPFQVEIKVPQKRFTLINDELAKKPFAIRDNYRELFNVPVGIDLKDNKLIGIIGGKGKKGAVEVARALSVHLASSNCYTDVKLGYVYEAHSSNNEWSFAKWLPHTWSEDKKSRFVAENTQEASDVFFELANIMRVRVENGESKLSKNGIVKPHYILFVENPEILSGELLSKYIYSDDLSYGLTTILLVEKYTDLPNVCECIIQNDNNFKGMYYTVDNRTRYEIDFDTVSASEAETFARRISGIEVSEIETGGEVPNSLTFLEMYGVNKLEELNVLERWRKNRTYDSMKALIGKKSGGSDCYLDIHEKYHGPHGLIAGTTGSGKSETLQTYMLSLALNFSPNDIGFFVIDFKGGGMANLFSDLPHMIGQISNLSGNQIHRAMVSIKSENMRRQRIFTEHGVNNINLYTRLVKNNEASIPIPHLFIIIDEFAELKKEQPEFMRELISVAQVGRSLGVHLILATQKPSGTVDDNIWSNSKFRLCLRVQDRQDSNDMLHKPDAAYITQAGRCYLQVGNDELYEYFQSGWSGAEYDADADGVKTTIANMIGNTGKTTIIGSRTKIKKRELQRNKWFKTLIQSISNVLKSQDITIEDCKSNKALFDSFAPSIYKEIEAYGYDYEQNKFNSARLESFYSLWLNSEKDTVGEQIEEIIYQAQCRGLKLPEVKENTQLESMVEYLKNIAEENGYNYNLKLWLPVLPEEMYLSDIPENQPYVFSEKKWPEFTQNKWTLDVMVGMYDDPVNQAQKPFVVDFANGGHHAICGVVVSGKSTFLQTLIYALINKYTPQQLNIYGIDFSSKMLSAFENAPHVGGIMYENTLDRIDKFFNMIFKILDERKKIFKGGSYSQYVRSHGFTIPSIVIAIDNYANFREKTNDKYGDRLIQLAKNGEGNGIYLVVTGGGFGMAEIPNRFADNFRSVVSLDMGDKFKFADVLRTMQFDTLPENVRGRGLASVEGRILEFHTALATEASDDYQRMEKISALSDEMSEAWTGASAEPVPEIPEKPTIEHLESLAEYKKVIQKADCLPFAYNQEDASIYSVDLSTAYSYLIGGKAKTGKTNLLKGMVSAAVNKQARIFVMDIGSSELKKYCAEFDEKLTYVNTDDDALFNSMKELTDIFIERTKQRKIYIDEGLEEFEIFEKMSVYQPVFVFINDLVAFIKSMYSSEGRGKDVVKTLENLVDKGKLHNVYFISCINTDKQSEVVGLSLYDYFTADKNGVLLGGNAGSQRLFDFNGVPFGLLNVVHKPGIGIIPPKSGETEVNMVVVPLVGGKK